MEKKQIGKNLEGKTILITGGAGFIGSNLASKISQFNPKEIIIVDSLVKGLGGNVNNIPSYKNVTLLVGENWDIKNIPEIKPLLKKTDYVFNLAGSIQHNPLNNKKLDFDLNINLIPQLYFLEACRQTLEEDKDKFLSIVFSGTRDQYGKLTMKDLPVKEDFLPKEFTDYQSINKNAVESYHFLLYSSMKGAAKNFFLTSARLVNTYGPKQDLNCGAVVPLFIKKMMKGEVIELHNGGDVLRDFNYVDDVTDALILLGTSEKASGNSYNLGCCIGKKGMSEPIGDNLKTLKDFAYTLRDINHGGEIIEIPRPKDKEKIEPGSCCSDITKINKELGWAPQINLKEGLIKSLRYYK